MQNKYEKTELPGCGPFSKKLWFAIPNIPRSKRKSFFLSVVLKFPRKTSHSYTGTLENFPSNISTPFSNLSQKF